MAGTNPDGSHYDDPGVPWVSYFHGGDALHGFIRASYGTTPEPGLRGDAAGQRRRRLPLHPDRDPRHHRLSSGPSGPVTVGPPGSDPVDGPELGPGGDQLDGDGGQQETDDP